MNIAIGGDHAGFTLKEPLIEMLEGKGHTVTDFGTYSLDPVDFPDIAAKVCTAVRNGDTERGILVCGTGVGASIAANKTPGIRAAVCHDIHSAHQCVEHDDVNLLAIGAWIVGIKVAEELIDAFLDARFDDEPDVRRRVQKLHDMELWAARLVLSERGDEA